MYEKGKYAGMDEETIRTEVISEGFDPILISDPPGTPYPPHRHATTKLLAFLKGSMEITFGGKTYHCTSGDKVVIPGDVEHSARVGPEGCVFLWSEILR